VSDLSPAVPIQPPRPGARVIVGISGGVDSAVSAALLKDQGFAVEGLFMKNWEEDDGTEYCTALEDLADAERVCERLDIPLRTANFSAEYWDNVFEDFLDEYRSGRTPNPDVLCNREIKFKQFADYAQSLGADYIATGHYARSAIDANGQYQLLKGIDQNKDQSYFLQAVPAAQLQHCLFPLGEWEKTKVRAHAETLGLHNHARKDSTGICFIGERRFADFLARYVEANVGVIVADDARKLATHTGSHQYTLGQRQGLQLGGIRGRPEAPWYVTSKPKDSNTVVVTQDPALMSGRWLRASQVNWLVDVRLPISCHAKIRYRQADQPCRVSAAADGQIRVAFAQPQRAITPGQFVALYNDQQMIGGARIEHADPATTAYIHNRQASSSE